MTRLVALFARIGLVVPLLAACQSEAPSGGVAILDLERAANETGYLRQLNARLDTVKSDLQGQLSKVQGELSAQLTAKQEKFGDKPSKEQKEELNKLFTTAQLQLQQAQQQAVSLIDKERSQLVAQLHDSVRPYAKQVAGARGLQVVMLRSDALVFDHDPATDITNDVIAAMIRAKSTIPAPQAAATPAAETATAVATAAPAPEETAPSAAGD